MSIKYNLSVKEALELFLGDAECGMPETSLARLEKQMGAAIHPTVREFAEKYFYLPLNSGETRLGDFHIAYVWGEVRANEYLVIGYDEDESTIYGVQSPDSRENPPLYIGSHISSPEGEAVSWKLSTFTLDDFFGKVIAEGLEPYCQAAFGCEKEDISRIAAIFGADLKELDLGGDRGTSLCYNEERHELAVFRKVNGELKAVWVFAETKNHIERAPFGGNTDAELKQFFEEEFYINSMDCNFEYALTVNSERVKRARDSGAPKTQAAELERLSARCLWALGRHKEAEKLLNSAALAFTQSLTGVYTALSNMYDELGEGEKREKALSAVTTLSELSGDYDSLGLLYLSQGMKLDKDPDTIDRAIELYEKALETFRKMPKPNKHDIARAQQLRGEARHRKKDMLK